MLWRDTFGTRRGATGLVLMAAIGIGGAVLAVEFWVIVGLLVLVAIVAAG